MDVKVVDLDDGVRLTMSAGSSLQLSASPAQAGGHWYGGPVMASARWPASLNRITSQVWQSNDMLADRQTLGSVLEGQWITSAGASIRILPSSTALDVSFAKPSDDDAVELHLRTADGASADAMINVELRGSDDVCAAHRLNLAELPRPSLPQSPSLELMRAPVWSTWARYKMHVDQSKVMAFASEIVARDFPRSHLEVDDKWSSKYGDFVFDPIKFPEPRKMVDALHDLGFSVTVWITPFAEAGSDAYVEGARLGHWMKTANEEVAKVTWWQGEGVVLNVTDERALDWFERRLRTLMAQTGVDGFKFDAGEAAFVPEGAMADPNDFTGAWARFAARFGGAGEVRAAHNSQDAGVWLREFDKDSRWGLQNGLHALITSALHQGVLGYPFVLPDMVGGNAYSDEMTPVEGEEAPPQPKSAGSNDGQSDGQHAQEAFIASDLFFGELPSRELYVRWCFANALLPAVQFSIAPWQYDEEAVAACRKALDLRASYLPLMEALAHHAVATGEPIVRPLWYHDPHDDNCLTIDDQFLLGNGTLVAPVLRQGVTKRSVYLPRGTWAAHNGREAKGAATEASEHVGPAWLVDYPVALDELPVFVLVRASSVE